MYDRERIASVLERLPTNIRDRLERSVQELIDQDIPVPAPSLLRLSALTLEQYSQRMLPKHAVIAWMFAIILRERARMLGETPGRAGRPSAPAPGGRLDSEVQEAAVDAPGQALGLSSPRPGAARVSA